MDMWTPLFSRIVDSSIWLENDMVVKVFITMLAKRDHDNIVRGTAFNIASWAKKTEAEVLEALKVLASPDKKRIEPQPFDGRRIERVEGGWMILNGDVYQAEMRKISRAVYQKKKQREYRLKKKEAAPGEGFVNDAEDTGVLADQITAEIEANRAEANGETE